MNLWWRIKYFLTFLQSIWSLNTHLIRGMWRLTSLSQPAVTIFGGSRIHLDDPAIAQASLLAKKLAEMGFSIITGGGRGIMEAANFGALKYLDECKADPKRACKKNVSGAIGLVHLNQDQVNPYVQTHVIMDHFFSRKWLLVRYSSAFVIFSGGFGTLDEFFEILTLVQTNRMPHYPIFLIGSDYWKPLLEWIETRALAQKLINSDDVKLFVVSDDVDAVAQSIKEYHLARQVKKGKGIL